MADGVSLRDLFRKAGKVVDEAVPQDSIFRNIGKTQAQYEAEEPDPVKRMEAFQKQNEEAMANPYGNLIKIKDAAAQVGANLAYRAATGEVKQNATAEDVGAAVASGFGASGETQEYASKVASMVPMASSLLSGKVPKSAAVAVRPNAGYGALIHTGVDAVAENQKMAQQAARKIGEKITTAEESGLIKKILFGNDREAVKDLIKLRPDLVPEVTKAKKLFTGAVKSIKNK